MSTAKARFRSRSGIIPPPHPVRTGLGGRCADEREGDQGIVRTQEVEHSVYVSTDYEKINALKSRSWYRLVQVLYVVAIFIVMLVGFFPIYFITEPQKVYDYTNIVCDNGHQFKREIYQIDTEGRICNGIHGEFDSVASVGKAVKSLYPEYSEFTDDAVGQAVMEKHDQKNLRQVNIPGLEPGYKNFTEQDIYEDVGSWPKVIFFTLIYMLFVLFLFEVLRRMFLYIVARVSPLYKPKWLGTWRTEKVNSTPRNLGREVIVMKEKKRSRNWYIAATHYLTSGLVMPLIITFIATFILAMLVRGESPILVVANIVILPLSLWLGARYSASFINRRYVVPNAQKVVKLSTVYLVVVWGATYLYFLMAGGATMANVVNIIAFIIGGVVFYRTSQKYLKQTNF